MSTQVYQDRRTGKRVVRVGAQPGEEGFVMVRGNDGPPYHVSLRNLIPVDEKGVPDFDAPELEVAKELEEQPAAPVVPIAENRLNVNTASAEQLIASVKGLPYRTAKRIKQMQLGLPGEKFSNLDQLREASTRVNWDEIFRENKIFVG